MKTCRSCGAVWDDAYDLCSFDGGLLDTIVPGARVIGERYLLEQRVAAGAMGVVFRATHLQLGSTVAVKLMQPMQEALVVGLLRFHREAQILGQIKHPNAVLVIDFGVEEREEQHLPYLVTEFLRGEGLDVLLEREDVLPPSQVADILIPVCEAVHEAHEIGVIHRDIKPSNVFLEKLRDGSTIVKVLDFGIAKFVEVEPAILERKRAENAEWALRLAESSANDPDAFLDEVAQVRSPRRGSTTAPARPQPITLDGLPRARISPEGSAESPDECVDDSASSRTPTVTEAGFMVGTIPYMAPEQMTGDAVSRLTDVYAIATLGFQLLTGSLPFEGDDDTIISQKLSSTPPSAIERGAPISDALDQALQQALNDDPSLRGEGALSLAQAFVDEGARIQSESGSDQSLSLSIQTGALVRILVDVTGAVSAIGAAGVALTTGEHYAIARDRLLALPGPLLRTQRQLSGFSGDIDDDERDHLQRAATELDRASTGLTQAIGGLQSSDGAEFLRVLWLRALPQVEQVHRGLEHLAPSDRQSRQVMSTVKSAPSNPFAPAPPAEPEALLVTLETARDGDDLDASDAAERLLTEMAPALREHLGQGHVSEETVESLWRHCDRLLLRELYATDPPRVLPLLNSIGAQSAAGFSTLATLFGDIDASADEADDARSEFLATPFAQRRPEDVAILDRCLSLHPSDDVRDQALERIDLATALNFLLCGPLPLPVLRHLFERAKEEAQPDEYLKVFFLCIKDLIRSATDADLDDAFALMRTFFSIDCFHEDVVFEPLIDLDQWLLKKADAAGFADIRSAELSAHAALSAAFTAKGMRESKMDSLRSIPLAVQRKLAREGHFIERFMTHPVDKVALETLPHLMRREDVARILRVPTIHRSVITELAKVRRLFRKDQARLALLQNPKTPANVARIYLPLLPHAQVQNLSRNKHISEDVRALAQTFADKLIKRQES